MPVGSLPSSGCADSAFLGIHGEVGSQARGTMSAINLCVLSTLANAACLSTSGKLLTEKVDVLRLTFYISPICAAFILPFTLYFEVRSILLEPCFIIVTVPVRTEVAREDLPQAPVGLDAEEVHLDSINKGCRRAVCRAHHRFTIAGETLCSACIQRMSRKQNVPPAMVAVVWVALCVWRTARRRPLLADLLTLI